MQLRLLLETLDRLDEGLFKTVKAAVELEPDPDKRRMILAKIAQENNLPGLYDPTDGTYYNVNGEMERSPDNAITQKLGSLGLVPKNAKTSMFGFWGADDVKNAAVNHTVDINGREYTDELLGKLNDLVKKVGANLKESKKRKKSLSNVLYESFFGLEEAEDYSIGSGYKGPKIGSGYSGPKIGGGPTDTPAPSEPSPSTTLPPQPAPRNDFSKEIEEMKKIIEELTAINQQTPNPNIVSAIERAQEVMDRAAKQPTPNTPSTTPNTPSTTSPDAPGPRANVFTDPDWAKNNFSSLKDADRKPREMPPEPKPPEPKPPTPTPGPVTPPAPGPGPIVGPATDDKNAKKRKELKALIDQLKGKKGGGGSGPVDQRPTTSDSKITKMQRELLAAGADLGTFGPNGDGIDGKMGKKTREAMKKFPKIAAKYGFGGTNPRPAPTPTPPETDFQRRWRENGFTGDMRTPAEIAASQDLSGETTINPTNPNAGLLPDDPRWQGNPAQHPPSGQPFDPRAAIGNMSADELRRRFPNPRDFGEFDRGGSRNTREESAQSEDDRILRQIKNVRF
jgi:hypothetical protein